MVTDSKGPSWHRQSESSRMCCFTTTVFSRSIAISPLSRQVAECRYGGLETRFHQHSSASQFAAGPSSFCSSWSNSIFSLHHQSRRPKTHRWWGRSSLWSSSVSASTFSASSSSLVFVVSLPVRTGIMSRRKTGVITIRIYQ